MAGAAGYCRLQAVVGRAEPCPGGACAFWDEGLDTCVFRDVEHELRRRPALASHLLDLRRAVEARREGAHSRFSRLLNEEQEAKPS